MTGKSHAASVTKAGSYEVSQSGVWDKDILCGKCDGKLGGYEQYAHRIAQAIRQTGSDTSWKTKVIADTDNIKILRFCAGILYKYSLTTKANGQITLGRYQDVLRSFIFDQNSDVPPEIDAFVVRPLKHDDDGDVFAYRAPSPDRKFGVNLYRMMMGGLIFFVQLDQRPISGIPQEMLIKNRADGLPFVTGDAASFEEFTIPRGMTQTNERLSAYLDRIS
ncbi:hypothetical protein [Arthrobacter sp. ZGTC412]|uniref:hypothetical protein n=1 Tax=Arthrobacter sp. ZGTC412 TaxID=2058900 RepID=UPI000CE52BC6|nr:hypothetical protein [Arthrobacter sp. ZGTC412]